MKHVRISTAFVLIPFLVAGLLAQEGATVTGRVIDATTGAALPGANVYIDDLALGAASGVDGYYRFDVPASAVLGQVVEIAARYIGYSTATASITLVSGAITQDFQMERDVIGLEEVVVTGLGITREKKAIGYAVQDVSGEDLTLIRESNIVNSLSGRVAGLQITPSSGAVGSSSRIILRGNSSLSGNNQPLFVVDGIPIDNTVYTSGGHGGIADMGNAAADISSYDVESVTVLKGPNAAAIYGSRAANGVVLITTKSAKGKQAGTGTGVGLGISYESHITTRQVATLPDYQNAYGQGFSGEFEYVDGNGSGTFDHVDESWGPPLDTGLKIPQWDSPVVDGVRQATDWVSQPDNVRSFFETGMAMSHNLALSGVGPTTHFRLSMSNTDETGMFPNTDQNRTNLNFTGGIQLTTKLSGQASGNYIRTKNDNLVGNGYDGNNPLQQMMQWFGRQVDMEKLKEDYQNDDGTPINWNTSYHDNPYWIMNKNTNSRLRDRFIGNFSLLYDIISGVNIQARVGTDWYNEDRKLVRAVYTNSYPDGWFRAQDYYRNETNADLLLRVSRNLSPGLSLNATAGANYRSRDYRAQTTTVTSLIIPDLYAVSNAAGVPQTTLSETHLVENSVYGTASLGIAGFLFIDGTARNDWSSTLPKDNWSYFYPSLTTSIIFSEALGLDPSFLWGKVRASWSKVGASTSPYRTSGVYGAGDPWTGIANLSYTNDMPNLNLKPEVTASTEIGTELKFFNNMIGLDATYYKAVTTNQILELATSRTSGYSSQLINAGQVTNKGLELYLTASPIRSDNFSWDIGVNWAKNTNVVDSLYGDMERVTLYYGGWALYVTAEPGGPYGDIFGRAIRRDPDGNRIIDSDGLYKVESAPSVIGNVVPDWVGGINNTFRFGPVTVNALIDARMGGDIFSVTHMFGIYAGLLKESVWDKDHGGLDYVTAVDSLGNVVASGDFRDAAANYGGGALLDGVIEVISGTDTSYVANTGDNMVISDPEDFGGMFYGKQELSVFDGSYIKLRNLAIGFDLPQSLVSRLGVARATLSVEGKNLAILYKTIPHIDPETAFSAGQIQGIESNAIPQAREFGINLRIAF